MKRAYLFVIPSVFLAVVIGFAAALGLLSNNAKATQPTYIVKEYSGKVALFTENNPTPDEIYDIYVESLPKSDREKLENGITLHSKTQLNSLLEDYDG